MSREGRAWGLEIRDEQDWPGGTTAGSGVGLSQHLVDTHGLALCKAEAPLPSLQIWVPLLWGAVGRKHLGQSPTKAFFFSSLLRFQPLLAAPRVFCSALVTLLILSGKCLSVPDLTPPILSATSPFLHPNLEASLCWRCHNFCP